VEIPYRAIKTNIAESLNLIVQIERRPGVRFVSEMLDICGYNPESDQYEFRRIKKRLTESALLEMSGNPTMHPLVHALA
jgi:hypothetical protein